MAVSWNAARTAGTAGFACGALLLVDMISSPELGEPGESPARLVHYSRAAGGTVAVWGAVGGLSVLALVVMVWSIGRLGPSRAPGTGTVAALVGGAGLFTAVGLDHVAGVATYYVAEHLRDPADAVTALSAVRFAATPLASLSIAIVTGAVAVEASRSRSLSRPVVILGGVVAALNLLGAASGARAGTFELNAGLFVFLGLFGFLVWDLTASTSLLRHARLRDPAAVPAPRDSLVPVLRDTEREPA